ncbi:unnamed protein product, partial [marine sediment metagenome]
MSLPWMLKKILSESISSIRIDGLLKIRGYDIY